MNNTQLALIILFGGLILALFSKWPFEHLFSFLLYSLAVDEYYVNGKRWKIQKDQERKEKG